MLAILENSNRIVVSKQNARVKDITPEEKDIIKNVFGNDPEIPKTIYNRIQTKLNNGQNVSAILKIKTDDGSSYWTVNRFEPSINNSFKSNFTVSTSLTNNNFIKKIQCLYNRLTRIENHLNEEFADKYLEGFLEEKCIDFSEFATLYASKN